MKKHIFLLIILILFLLIFPEDYVFGKEKREFSLSDCLNIGLTNNLDIKIAKIEARIKGQDVMLAESIFDTILNGKLAYTDDRLESATSFAGAKTLTNEYEFGITKTLPTGTELDIGYSDTRLWTDSVFAVNNPTHTSELSFALRQPVLRNFFGYVDRKIVKLSKIEADIAGVKAKDRIENAIADIGKTYWYLVFRYQDVTLHKELYEEAKELYERFTEHVTIGLVEETELYEIEANMRIRKADLLVAKNNLETASNQLLFLLNEEEDFLIVPKDALKTLWGRANLINSLSEAFIANRDYRIKKKELTAKNVNLKMKENSLWPEVDLVGTFALNGVDRRFEKATGRITTGKHPYYYGGIEFSVPIENREARSEYNKASLEKEKAILEVLQIEKDLVTTIDKEVRNVNLNFENAKRWTKIKEIQYRKFREEEKKLGYGRSRSKIVVDFQNDFTIAAISEYETIMKYYIALIDLENAKDTLLKQVGIVE